MRELEEERSAALQKTLVSAFRRSTVNREYVLAALQEVAERCMQRRPVRDANGKVLGDWTFNPASAIRALELLGKQLGLFSEPEKRREGDQFDRMSAEELRQWLLNQQALLAQDITPKPAPAPVIDAEPQEPQD